MPEIHISSSDNNNHLERELRKFKRLVDKSGIPSAARKKQFHVKPTAERKRMAAAARKRWDKKLKKEEESMMNMMRSRLYRKSKKSTVMPEDLPTNKQENKDQPAE